MENGDRCNENNGEEGYRGYEECEDKGDYKNDDKYKNDDYKILPFSLPKKDDKGIYDVDINFNDSSILWNINKRQDRKNKIVYYLCSYHSCRRIKVGSLFCRYHSKSYLRGEIDDDKIDFQKKTNIDGGIVNIRKARDRENRKYKSYLILTNKH